METKEIKIKVPEGYEVDQENSTFECIKFKPVKNKLPKTWEEYCKTYRRQYGESWVDWDCKIETISDSAGMEKDTNEDRNLLPSKELAEAMLALCQLIQLRDCYNDGWTPDWTDMTQEKSCIYVTSNTVSLALDTFIHANCILAFRTEELRDRFFKNFRDLIEIAKPLL